MEFKRLSFWQEVKHDIIANHHTGKFNLQSIITILLFCPGGQLLFSYRLQNRLVKIPVIGKILAKFIWVITTWLTSCHVDPNAKIEGGICFPHATAIVISRSAIIKSGVTIYQGVTIGIGKMGTNKAPYIGNNVVIYAGAQVIGDITVGDNAVIGANAVVTRSVPDGKTAIGIPAKY